jgi:hypothetical protein
MLHAVVCTYSHIMPRDVHGYGCCQLEDGAVVRWCVPCVACALEPGGAETATCQSRQGPWEIWQGREGAQDIDLHRRDAGSHAGAAPPAHPASSARRQRSLQSMARQRTAVRRPWIGGGLGTEGHAHETVRRWSARGFCARHCARSCSDTSSRAAGRCPRHGEERAKRCPSVGRHPSHPRQRERPV